MRHNIIGRIAVVIVASLALASSTIAGGHGKGASKSAGHGNSAFGHRQGNSTTRTTGSQNSQYGKDKAAAAKPTPAPTPDA